MAYNLLIAAGASTTSPWIWVQPSKDVSYPMRVIVVSHGWTAGNLILEEMVRGTPGFGATSPYSPQSDTGSVLTLATLPPGSGDTTITTPVEYLRARTDAGIVGTVDVNVVMDS